MSDPVTSVIVNGITITKSDVARFAPVVCYCKRERFSPCTIEYLLEGSTWMRVPWKDDETDWSAGVSLPGHPTPDNLGTLEHHGRDVKVQLDPTHYPGQGWTSPMYVVPQIPKDQSYVQFTYIFLYAFNGPQCIRLEVLGLGDNLQIPSFAQHEGDIESVTVRVDRGLQDVLLVRYEHHGDSFWYTPDRVAFDPTGKRPLVGCALNSHASYNIYGRSGQYKIVLDDYTKFATGFEVIDLIQTDWRQWQPSDFIFVGLKKVGYDLRLMSWGDGSGVPTSGKNLVIVGIDNNGLLHIRIFDASGNKVTDTDETQLPATQAVAITTLKQQLLGLLPPHVLTGAEKAQLVGEATSIVGQTRKVGDTYEPQWGESWVAFSGRLGRYDIHSPTGVLGADRDLLPFERNLANELLQKAYDGHRIPAEFLWSIGPIGLFPRISVMDVDNPAVGLPISEVAVRCNERPYLALSVDPNNSTGPLMVSLYTAATNQIWSKMPEGRPETYVLINKLSGLAATAPRDKEMVIQEKAFPPSGSDTWNQSGKAIRPYRDLDMNLNVASADNIPRDGSGVCVWDWKLGQPNETWTVEPVSTIRWPISSKEVYVRMASRPLYLTATPGDSHGEVAVRLYSGDDRQKWAWADYGYGFALINAATGKWMSAPENLKKVILVDPGKGGESSLWSVSQTDKGLAIRPKRNEDMNLNASNNQDNIPKAGAVCVWDGGLKKPNETWSIVDWGEAPKTRRVAIKCRDHSLALQPTSDSRVQVQTYTTGQVASDQVWRLSNVEYGYCTLQHERTGRCLKSPSSRTAGEVHLGDRDNYDDTYLWDLSAPVIRIWGFDALNLNVAAKDNVPRAGEMVYVWSWGRGNPNEVWSVEYL